MRAPRRVDMHPSLSQELARLHQAELAREARRHELAALARPERRHRLRRLGAALLRRRPQRRLEPSWSDASTESA
jgi:hypothetical protein